MDDWCYELAVYGRPCDALRKSQETVEAIRLAVAGREIAGDKTTLDAIELLLRSEQ